MVTPSGGASEIIADRAEDEGLALPAFAPATTAALKAMLPAFADVANPLDVTGYVVVDRTLLGRALEIVVTDPGLDVVLLLADVLRDEPADPALPRMLYEANAHRIAASPRPVVVVSNALTDITPAGRKLLAEQRVPLRGRGHRARHDRHRSRGALVPDPGRDPDQRPSIDEYGRSVARVPVHDGQRGRGGTGRFRSGSADSDGEQGGLGSEGFRSSGADGEQGSRGTGGFRSGGAGSYREQG